MLPTNYSQWKVELFNVLTSHIIMMFSLDKVN